MRRNVMTGITVVCIAAAIIAVLLFVSMVTNRAASTHAGFVTTASLVTQSGTQMGIVTFEQLRHGVAVTIEASGLSPGEHAVAVHAVGNCTHDFASAGDHFQVERSRVGIVHPNWIRSPVHGEHGGDLGNIYAHADGYARADFVTNGFTLQVGHDHSVFDADGAAVVIHELPQVYGVEKASYGARIGCGVIDLNW